MRSCSARSDGDWYDTGAEFTHALVRAPLEFLDLTPTL